MSAVRVAAVGAGGAEGPAGRVVAALGAVCEAGADEVSAAAERLGGCAAVYVAEADDPDLFVHARTSAHLVVSARAIELLVASCIPADVVVVDGGDPAHDVDETELPVAPGAIVVALGPAGGRLRRADGSEDVWGDGGADGAPALGAGVADAVGAAVAVALARGEDLAGALALGARVGVAVSGGEDGGPDMAALAALPA